MSDSIVYKENSYLVHFNSKGQPINHKRTLARLRADATELGGLEETVLYQEALGLVTSTGQCAAACLAERFHLARKLDNLWCNKKRKKSTTQFAKDYFQATAKGAAKDLTRIVRLIEEFKD